MIGVGLAQPQIIGMSATLANIEDLLKFLDAQFYEELFRPVELEEYVKIHEDVYKIDRNLNELVAHRQIDFKVGQTHFSPKDFLLKFQYTKQHLLNDPDRLVGLGATMTF